MLLPIDPTEPPLSDADLDAYFEWEEIHDEEDVDPDEAPTGVDRVLAWSVCDTGSAEYAMRSLAHAEARLVELTTDAERFHEQIDRWLAGEAKRPRQASNFFEGQLEAYARRRREEDGAKTLNLPSGSVTSRLNPARPEVPKDAEEVFIEWARTTPMVKPKWSPVMAEVKKRVTFATVRVPDFGHEPFELVPWPDADGAITAWVALPRDTAEEHLKGWREIPALDLPNFHDEVWPICEGQRVPGVVQVPAEVTFTVKADLL